ncbi:MAG: hypothetical protein QOI65_1062 [Thermoleophilaceae bacterium]|nr:hypothetical protein [Thermoleophilaceae bacterium]
MSRRQALIALGGTGALAVLARAPFIASGIGPDEGGYAYVAREWARGARLYEGIWIDRPQGLISVYRAIVTVADHPWAIRLGALLIGVAITLLIGAIGWMLRGPITGIAAAAIYAVVGAGPHIEGFTLNGELAAALPATAAVAVATAWWRGGRRWTWLFAAGVLGGGALLMKQGGFDGLVAATALAYAAGASTRERARGVAVVAAGALVPVGAALLHALSVGFGTYWTDVVAFRLSSEFHDGSRSDFFDASFPAARQDVFVLAAVALVGLAIAARRRTERVLLVAWLLAALVAFNVGGLFWAHYYVQLVPPLAVLAGIGATALGSRRLAVALCCAAVAPVGVTLVDLETKPAEAREAAVAYENDYELDTRVAAFVRSHTAPADTIYVVDSRADIYYLADRRTPYPYLWHHSPLLTRRGLQLMRLMLTGPDRPRAVAVYRDPGHLDPSGALTMALHRGYRLAWRPAPGVRVLLRRLAPFGRTRLGGNQGLLKWRHRHNHGGPGHRRSGSGPTG